MLWEIQALLLYGNFMLFVVLSSEFAACCMFSVAVADSFDYSTEQIFVRSEFVVRNGCFVSVCIHALRAIDRQYSFKLIKILTLFGKKLNR